MREVIVTVDGSKVTIDAVGFQGEACEKATAEIEKLLGEVQKKETKAERYEVGVVPVGGIHVSGGGY